MRRQGLIVIIAVFCLTIFARPLSDNRVALVIGNGAYAYAPHLPNPPHDAEDVAAALKRVGFETIMGLDLNQAGMQDAAIRFSRAARNACANAGDHWKSADAIGSSAAYEDHLARFPNCSLAGLAKARMEALKSKVAALPSAATSLESGAVRPCKQFDGEWQTSPDLAPMHITQNGCSLTGSFTSASGVYRHIFTGTAKADSASVVVNRIDGKQCQTKLNTVITSDAEGKLVWRIIGTSGLCGLPAGYQETRVWNRIAPDSLSRSSNRAQ